jgi:hypothetical protein
MAGWVSCFGSSRCPRSFDCPHILQHPQTHKPPAVDSLTTGTRAMAQWHCWGNNGSSSPPPTNELHHHHPDRYQICLNPARSPDLLRPCERHGIRPQAPQRDHSCHYGRSGAGGFPRCHHEGRSPRSVVCSHRPHQEAGSPDCRPYRLTNMGEGLTLSPIP